MAQPKRRRQATDTRRPAGDKTEATGPAGGSTGPSRGDFLSPSEVTDADERADALPAQEEFWRPPVRFGSVPVEKEPLGWDRRKGFRKCFPSVSLPFQVIDRVTFGHPQLEPNRLFWGDNLHVMRQLPSESIDLIYIDPPFFSGRQYNVIFGDQNELRSFSDIWEGGMPGYLIWLNARLYEMKRLLKKTGSIYVHCDWHASHYIKMEMDKLFGHDSLRNEVVWYYNSGARKKTDFGRRHDILLRYSRTDEYFVDFDNDFAREPYSPDINIPASKAHYYDPRGKVLDDVWRIPIIPQNDRTERLGYPTQKPEKLLERVIATSCPHEGVVADFFCGGGTTPAVAQRLGRRWIACDQSRVAAAITADRLARGAEQLMLEHVTTPIPDFTVEHWGVYEARRLSQMPHDQFRLFVLRCFGAVPESGTGVPPVTHGQDARATVDIRQGAYLPHWTAQGATYAVTFRLADSLPQKVLEAWLAERESIVQTARQLGRPLSEQEEKRLHQLRSEKIERYLDAGHGACWMKEDQVAGIVANALKHFDGEHYDLLAWCVMPNHVHVVVRPHDGHELPDILHSWKSFSAKEANKVLRRKGEFWQPEYYDHLIRNEKDFAHAMDYVLTNPEAARLKEWKWVGFGGGMAVPTLSHGKDARAAGGTRIAPVNHGQDGRATIHGYKGAVPVWVGDPDQKKGVSAQDVQDFANAIRKTLRYQQDNLRDGLMLAWAFRPDAVEAADRLRKLEQTELNFIRLEQVRIDSPRFREHVSALSTDHADYANFLTFVQPPRVEVGWKRIAPRTCKFDVSETAILNPGARIINVQWDFDYRKRFTSTPGYSFAARGKDKQPELQAQFEFPAAGTYSVACKVQDDMGGEGTWTGEVEVT